jgi:hypothetical protein
VSDDEQEQRPGSEYAILFFREKHAIHDTQSEEATRPKNSGRISESLIPTRVIFPAGATCRRALPAAVKFGAAVSKRETHTPAANKSFKIPPSSS